MLSMLLPALLPPLIAGLFGRYAGGNMARFAPGIGMILAHYGLLQRWPEWSLGLDADGACWWALLSGLIPLPKESQKSALIAAPLAGLILLSAYSAVIGMLMAGLAVSGMLSRQGAGWSMLAVLASAVHSAGLGQEAALQAAALVLVAQGSLPVALLAGAGWVWSLPPPMY